jgi:hypothetical protein
MTNPKYKYNWEIYPSWKKDSSKSDVHDYSGTIKKIIEAHKQKKDEDSKKYSEIIEKLTKKKSKKENAQEILDKLNNDKELKLEFEKLLRKEKLDRIDNERDTN